MNWQPADRAEGRELKDVQVLMGPGPSEGAWAAALQQKSRELGRFMPT
ncbi:hypothetical protein [Streptomyces lydicus]